MRKKAILFLLFLLTLFQSMESFAKQRFPKPEFESAYTQPETLQPGPRYELLAYLDVLVLLSTLSLISWLILKKRSRKGVFWISIFSLAYFGFYREGCVCSIGAIQNVSLGLFYSAYTLPFTALAFFVIPLVFTLFYGRTFCAGVCPFGAMQDLVAIQPQKMGSRLNSVLGLLPYLYLGLAVLYAATGTDFIICRYDPFVGIFRLNASFGMFVFAGILLGSGVFIARPYCRFLCPYGVILNWFSRFSKKHMTITPANCIQCKLCENTCPYDAINIPITVKNPETKQELLKKFILICILIPVLIAAGGYTGSKLHTTLAEVNPRVRLAKAVMDPVKMQEKPESYEIKAFKSSGKPAKQLLEETNEILRKFYIGGWLLGGFMGLTFGLLIAGRLITNYNPDYVPNKGTCLSCNRCIEYCPVKV